LSNFNIFSASIVAALPLTADPIVTIPGVIVLVVIAPLFIVNAELELSGHDQSCSLVLFLHAGQMPCSLNSAISIGSVGV
jgi:hypothetical protein